MGLETVAVLTWALASAAVRPSTEVQLLRTSPAAFDGPRSYIPQTLGLTQWDSASKGVDTMVQSPQVQLLVSEFDRVAAELDSYLMLAPGWDGEHSVVPTRAAVAKAKTFLLSLPLGVPPPTPMVSSNGAAELYWDGAAGYVDVSFTPDGDMSIYGQASDGRALYEEGLQPDFLQLPKRRLVLEIVAPQQARYEA
jgi:hypothetical protein